MVVLHHYSFSNSNPRTTTPFSAMKFGFSSSDFTSSSPVSGDTVTGPFGSSCITTASFTTDTATSTMPTKTSEPSSTVFGSVPEKTCVSTTTTTPFSSGFLSSASSASSWPIGASFVSTDTGTSTMARAFFTFPPQPSSTVLSSVPCDSTTTPVAGEPLFSNSVSSATSSSSTVISPSLGPITSTETTSPTVSPTAPSDSVSSATSSSSVSATTTTVTATSLTVSAAEFATVADSCSTEQDEVAAILTRQCEKFLSCRAARPAQGRGENERHAWVFGATGFETTSSNKPVSDTAHIPAATAEQKYGKSQPCSVTMTDAPLTSNPSVPLESKSASLLLPSLQPAEEEPYFPPVDLLDSTIDMWVRVVGDKKTDQEVAEEGLRHFYEGINYFCLLSERLQVVTDKYNEAVKARDELEKTHRKLEDSEKEKERLEHELAEAATTITTLTGEKESLLQAQMIFHQKIFELTSELREAGAAAIQKYKASSLYKQELMEYAAPYMGKGVKLAIDKIKAKDPTFDPKTYGLEMYILPPEADYNEFSSNKEGDGGANQDQNEAKPSAAA